MEMQSTNQNSLYAEEGSAEDFQQPWKWRAFGLLMVASFIASFLIIPYSLDLLSQVEPMSVPLWLITIGTLVPNLIFSAIAIPIGLWLGQGIGLGAPALQAWLTGHSDEAQQQIRSWFPLAFGLGLATGVVLLLLGLVSTRLMPQPEIVHPPAWQGLLASISAGINEEIWLRFGLMTLFAWIGTKLTGGGKVGSGVAWTSIILATLAFGALHLPTAVALGELTLPIVAWVLLANGVAGAVFGWLYWRQGLLAAMLAHFSTDLIIHVLAPLFGVGA
jgi:hypothetical protein